MNLRYISAAIFTTALCLNLASYNSANANEQEPLCYFIALDNRVVNLSNLCGTKKRKSRLNKNISSSEVKVNTSTIRPPKISHYPPSKFHVSLLR
jgi:hypothetical protein